MVARKKKLIIKKTPVGLNYEVRASLFDKQCELRMRNASDTVAFLIQYHSENGMHSNDGGKARA